MTVSEDVLSIMKRQIEDSISNIPAMVTHLKNEDVYWKLMITTESEFILGTVWSGFGGTWGVFQTEV